MCGSGLTAEQRRFIASCGVDSESRLGPRIEPIHFGDSCELISELAALVLRGVKTATCSALWEWEAEGKPLPKPGDLGLVLDADDRPCCLIEITEVEITPYGEVDATFAHDEGEDDRTLESWREGHWRYFERVLPAIGRMPTKAMPLVCERFRVVGRGGGDGNRARGASPWGADE